MERKLQVFNEDVLKVVLTECYDINIFRYSILDAFETLNLHVITDGNDGQEEFVMKVSDAGKPTSLELQCEMMQHLCNRGITTTLPVATVMGTLTCEHSITTDESAEPSKVHIWMLHFVPGITLRKAGNPLYLLEDVGRLAGRIDAALQDFVPTQKPGLVPAESWVLPDVTKLETRLGEYCDASVVTMATKTIQEFRQSVLPVLDTFQRGYIHGDLHDCNIIVEKKTANSENKSYRVLGVIDFEDAEECYYVFEVAILMSDLMAARLSRAEPLHVAHLVLTGYRQEMTMKQAELFALRLCMCARLLHYYVMSGDSVKNDPDNAYVGLDRDNYLEMFKFLCKTTDEEFTEKVIEVLDHAGDTTYKSQS